MPDAAPRLARAGVGLAAMSPVSATAAQPGRGTAAAPAGRTIVYSALGREMEFFELDLGTADLARIGSIAFEAVIQYAWPNRARTMLYVATSNAGPMCPIKRQEHFVHALRIEPSGTLTPFGPAARLRHRPVHLTLDAEGRHVLLASIDPPHVTVRRIEPDGSVGAEVAQPPLEFGPATHQVRVTPPGDVVVVPSCAHHPTGAIPGSLRLFSYRDGRLGPLATVEADPAGVAAWRDVANGAHGFAARHVDFHPTRPWMYLCLEAQGEIRLFDCGPGRVGPTARFAKSTLEGATRGGSTQWASAIHVHPGGGFVYVTNRARDTEPFGDGRVFAGGVNDVAVFAIDQATGEPTLIQHADTQGIFPRTFGIDPTGRLLVVGNEEPAFVRDGAGVRKMPPSLAVFRIGEDGRLDLARRHDHPDNGQVCWWVGVERIPA